MKTCSKCKIEKPLTEYWKGSKSTCSKCQREYKRKKYQDNKEYRDKCKNQSSKYYYDNIEFEKPRRMAQSKQWIKDNKEKHSSLVKNNYKKRYNTDSRFKIEMNIRGRITDALRKNSKYYKTEKLIGCTIEEYKLHLKKHFKPGMNWDNHGTIWEIDHIIPCSSFDLTKKEQQLKCFNYTNVQPLFKTTAIAESLGYENEMGNRNKLNKLDI